MTGSAWVNPTFAGARRKRRQAERPLRRLMADLVIAGAVVGGSAALGAEAVYWHDLSEQPQAAGVSITSSAGWVRAASLGVKTTLKRLSSLMMPHGGGTTTANLLDAVNRLQSPSRVMAYVPVDTVASLEKVQLTDLDAGVPVVEFGSDDRIPWQRWMPGEHAVLVDRSRPGDRRGQRLGPILARRREACDQRPAALGHALGAGRPPHDFR